MTMHGFLNLGVSEVVDRTTGKPLGYVFVEPSGRGFFERWLLFTNPNNEFDVRPAPPHMTSWSLEDWRDKVKLMWQPDAYYVWAQADIYRYGEIHEGETWNRIPSSARLPEPTPPPIGGIPFQLDDRDNCVSNLVDLTQNNIRGRGFVVGGLSKDFSVEYWLVPPELSAANARSTAITPNTTDAACLNLDGFIEIANGSWQKGAAFAITACVNYHQPTIPNRR